MDDEAIILVQESFALVEPNKVAAAAFFYADLFKTAPEVKPYFAGADMAEQGAKLMKALATAVSGLRFFDLLAPLAAQLASSHMGYHVVRADYEKAGASLLRTLETGLGAAFTPEVKAAWATVYGAMSGAMINADYANA
jgi:hemoglobin-like flavoprotein